MKLHLVRFSQDVDLENLEATENFLVFRKEDGSTFRIPVPEETIQELLRQGSTSGAKKVAAADPVEEEPAPSSETIDEESDPEDGQDWTEFGSEEDPAFRGQIQLEEDDLEGDLEEDTPRRAARVPQNFLDDEDGVPAL